MRILRLCSKAIRWPDVVCKNKNEIRGIYMKGNKSRTLAWHSLHQRTGLYTEAIPRLQRLLKVIAQLHAQVEQTGNTPGAGCNMSVSEPPHKHNREGIV